VTELNNKNTFPMFCRRCGSLLRFPIFWCSKCRKSEITTGSILFRQLERLLEDERRAEIKDKRGDILRCEVEDCYENLAVLNCKRPAFEEGDVLAVVENGYSRPLGTVIESGDLILVALFENAEEMVKGREVLFVREAEQLVSYDLQLECLGLYKSGTLKDEEKQVFDIFFENKFNIGKKTARAKDYFILKLGGKRGEKELDAHQKGALERILGLEKGETLLIVGPPGTGKTSVIAKAALELADIGKKVLVTSHTNRAVDNVIGKLPVEITLRIGRPEKIAENVRPYMLLYKVKTRLGEKLRELENEIRKLREEKHKLSIMNKELEKEWSRIGIRRKSPVKKALIEIGERLKNLLEERNKMLKRESEALVNEAKIIGSTLVKSALWPVSNVSFDVAIIDEASQATITLALLGMLRAKSWVLIGDHYQLPPVFKTIEQSIENPEVLDPFSAFNRMIMLVGESEATWLRTHYRSNLKIINFVSKSVYGGKIIPHESCEDEKLKVQAGYLLDPERAAVFLHVPGSESGEGSKSNEAEIDAVKEIVKRLRQLGIEREKIGVITPYRAQRNSIKSIFGESLEVATVDAFQGREKDVIIFSAVATTAFSVRFVENRRRLNVAFTRAKKKLIVIANAHAPWSGLMKDYIEYAKENDSFFSF